MPEPKLVPEIEETATISKSGYLGYQVNEAIEERVTRYWSRWKWLIAAFAGVVSIAVGLKAWDINVAVKNLKARTLEAQNAVVGYNAAKDKIEEANQRSADVSREVTDISKNAKDLAHVVLQGNSAYIAFARSVEDQMVETRKALARQTDEALSSMHTRIDSVERDTQLQLSAMLSEAQRSTTTAEQNAAIISSFAAKAQAEYAAIPGLDGRVRSVEQDVDGLRKRFPQLKDDLDHAKRDALTSVEQREKAALQALESGTVTEAMKKEIADQVEKEVRRRLKELKGGTGSVATAGAQ